MEAGDEPFHEFILPEKPPGSIREAGRDAADDSADGDIRTEALDDIGQKGNIILRPGAEEVPGLFMVFRRHGSPFQELELMELEETHRKGIEHIGRCDHHLAGLSRKPQHQVSPGFQPCLCGHLERFPGTREVVPPVDPSECTVIDGFDAVFDLDDKSPGLDVGQKPQLVRGDAVRARPQHQPADTGKGERFPVAAGEGIQVGVCIGERLEIREVAVSLSGARPVEGDPGLQLPGDALPMGVSRMESIVVAKSATASGEGAVTVRAGEPAVHRRPLEALSVACPVTVERDRVIHPSSLANIG